ncbi:alcohol dehydrogenase catalytic domain-containing protein [Archangium violaceum]|uniref:alcohol dehydrogenase catalytic domain-containing protein n=1 Tax=Archangium violaceum TaxID=83451 RepID=UPI001EF0347F|nr:alcohol dehydrogenase catalytic domain-containing protein [Archangium violaceum]
MTVDPGIPAHRPAEHLRVGTDRRPCNVHCAPAQFFLRGFYRPEAPTRFLKSTMSLMNCSGFSEWKEWPVSTLWNSTPLISERARSASSPLIITGEIIEKGKDVEYLELGDLVTVPFNVACGRCRTCREQQTGVCLNVNASRPGGAYGYVDMGGWVGGQAQWGSPPRLRPTCSGQRW